MKSKSRRSAKNKARDKRLPELQEVETESQYKNQAHAFSKHGRYLSCLMKISKLIKTHEKNLSKILQGSVELLPLAWQYPQITCARITHENKIYITDNFCETKWKLASEIKVKGNFVGAVEVFYLEDRPKEHEGPFLLEEGALIEALAERFGSIIQLENAIEREKHLNLILHAIRNVNQLLVREKNREVLIKKTCDSLIETRGFSTAWIVLVDTSGKFSTAADSGFGKSYTPLLEQLKQDNLPACSGLALIQPGAVVVTDTSTTCRNCPLTKTYSDTHRICIRLEDSGTNYGYLSVSTPIDYAIEDEELVLLHEIAGDIGLGLKKIELEEGREQTEQKLRESLEYRKSILETTSVATIIIEEDTTIGLANKEFEKLSGYSKEEIEGKLSWTTFIAPDDLERLKKYHRQRRIQPETTIKQFEIIFINKAGNKRNILVNVDLIPGTKRSVASLLDLTERKQMVEELSTKNRELILLNTVALEMVHLNTLEELGEYIVFKLKEICDGTTVTFGLYDPHKKILHVKNAVIDRGVINDLVQSLGGKQLTETDFPINEKTYRELMQNPIGYIISYSEVTFGIVPERIGEIAQKAQGKDRFLSIAYVLEGELFGTSLVALSSKTPDPSPELINSFAHVATIIIKRIQVEQALRESEKRYRGLFENSPISLWEEDFSSVKQRLDALRKQGVTDIKAYLESHPQEVADCASLVRIINVNQASLELFNAKNKDQLLKMSVTYQDFSEELVSIAEGKTEFSREGIDQTLTGEHKEINVAWNMAPGFENNFSKVIVSIVDNTERKHAERLLNALNQAAIAIGIALTPQDIFNSVACQLKKLGFSCLLFPLNETKGRLFTKYFSYESALLSVVEKLIKTEDKDFSFPVDAVDMYRGVVREKKTIFIENSEQVIRQIFPKLAKKHIIQIIKVLRLPKSISAPLIVENRVIGVFSVQSDTLTQDDIPIINAFADQLASALSKVELLQNLKKNLEGSIQTIAAIVEARDPYTSGHQIRVADLAVSISGVMQLSKEQIEGIWMAGIIHDLGKIQVPAEILSKPGKLTELEIELIKTHPQVGFDLLKDIKFPWPIAQIILQHHEKIDGSGYPRGLKRDEILLESRILAVSDVVEAMSSHRPYRPALGIEKALKEINQNRGTLFDKEVVNACLKVFKAGYEFPKD